MPQKKITLWLTCALILMAVCTASAQEDRKTQVQKLKQFFEGKRVTVKIDMPAARAGVDLLPERAAAFDQSQYAKRVRDFGVAIKKGSASTVTEIEVSSDEIEFQLDGGGYGSFTDVGSEPKPINPPALTPKSTDEIEYETQLKTEQNFARINYLRSELNRLRSQREQRDRRNRADYDRYMRERAQIIWDRRRSKGSRFNIKFKSQVPANMLAPEAIMQTLSEYVDFPELAAKQNAAETAPAPAPTNQTQTVQTNQTAADVSSASYLGEWKNGRGEVLKIGGGNLQFGSGKMMSFREVFRVPAARAFGLEIVEAESGFPRFVSILAADGELKLHFYDSLEDLKNGANSKGEETWRR